MAFELPKLPYALDALAPVISKQTMEFHYGKHHQAYATNLNNLVQATAFESASLEKIIMEAEGPIFNNGAQVWNHSFYFLSLKPGGSGEPTGKLAEMLKTAFGSFSEFKEKFSKSAATLFGSGWAWLVVNNGKLEIVQESNAGNPLKKAMKPIFTIDVWEHAYYLDYQNKRPDYIAKDFDVVDWNAIAARL